MEKDELDKKLEVYRLIELIKTTRASWLIYMSREDSSSKPVTPLDKSNRKIKLRKSTEENDFNRSDGP